MPLDLGSYVSPTMNWQSYLARYPDIAAEARRVTMDGEFPSPEAYAAWHFQNYGQGEGRSITDPAPEPVAAATPTVPTADQLAAARGASRNDILAMIGERGLNGDQYNLGALIDRELGGASVTKPEDYNSNLESSILDRVLARAQDNQRTQLLGQVDQKIGTNYGDKTITVVTA
jgi:hypothetical protein